MKIERTKNATRNIIFGIIQKVYTLAVPFLMRTVMIYFMGVQYLGLSSLFASILQVLNLAELGVGSAMVVSMFKSIAEDDTETICALMRLYRTYYRIIGLVIAVAGCALLPFIPQLISGDVPPDINVYVLYLLELAATVLSYWLFAYKNCLIRAHQRADVSSKISLVVTTVKYGLQIAAVYFFKNYYIYLTVALATQALENIVTAIIAKKMYPKYKPIGKLPKEEVKKINGKVRDLFTSKIGGVVSNSVDTIVISAFLGLTLLAIYQNYFYILTAVIGVISIFFSACVAGIGNSFVTESKEKNFNDFKKFTLLIVWVLTFCTSCFLCLFQPFMSAWVGEELMLEFGMVICFCIYFVSYEISAFFSMFKDAAGAWHEDRFRPLVASLANLALNLILVNFWGLYGILASTFLTQIFISVPWVLHNLFRTVFIVDQKKKYLFDLLIYIAVIILVSGITYIPCIWIDFQNGWITFLVRFAVCVVVPNVLFILFFFKKKEFKETMHLINRITKYKLKPLNKYCEKHK